MPHLYTHAGMNLYEADFLDAVLSLGVVPGDILFVHSDIRVFGKSNIHALQNLPSAFVRILKESVGEKGVVIMPTFTYQFCKTGVFDIQKSPSEVGSLSEFFRTQLGAVRSRHPIFSVAAWGNDVKDILTTNNDSFGKGTIFDTLLLRNAKIILLGVSLRECTFMHYIEQMHAVPYRFLKTFHGIVKDHGREEEGDFTYFVRPLDGSVENDMTKLEPVLREKTLLHEARVGGASVASVAVADLFSTGMAALDADPYFLLTKPAV